jgi:DNA-binding FadR family transcriptional regulator
VIDQLATLKSYPETNKVQYAFNQLKEYIIKSKLAPGTELPSQEDLAARIGVSRVSVREAMSRAQGQGLVEITRGKRIKVASPTSKVFSEIMGFAMRRTVGDELLQLVEARQCMESQIARLAAKRATHAQIEAMKQILQEIETNGHDLELCAEKDMLFHDMLLKSTGNPVFQLMLNPLTDILRKSRQKTMGRADVDRVARANVGHRKVLEAIIERNGDKAFRAMHEHLEMAEEDLRVVTQKNENK